MKAPNIGPFQVLLCHFFSWHRAGRQRRPEGGYEWARCRGCGHTLRREPGGVWKLAPERKAAEFKSAELGKGVGRRRSRKPRDSG